MFEMGFEVEASIERASRVDDAHTVAEQRQNVEARVFVGLVRVVDDLNARTAVHVQHGWIFDATLVVVGHINHTIQFAVVVRIEAKYLRRLKQMG